METIAPTTQETTAPVTDTAPTNATTEPAASAEATPPKDQLADKFEVLAKKERALFRQRQAIAQKEKELQELQTKLKAFEEKKTKAKVNPLEYLSEAGLSYDELTDFMLNGGKPSEKSELQMLKEEFQRLREEQAEKERQTQEQQTAAQQAQQAQILEDFKSEIGEFLESKKDVYELTYQRNAVDDIFTTIQDAYVINLQDWMANGRQGPPPAHMDIQKAAEIVEEFYEKEVLKLAETQKLKQKLGIQAPSTNNQNKQPSKTLTNSMASTAASVVPAKTDEDRMRRALEKLAGQ